MKRRVLLCVAGLSPQIVTETVYALWMEARWKPEVIQVLTTQSGLEQVSASLLSQGQDWLGRLCREYRMGEIEFNESNILVIKDSKGHGLEDIRTESDNLCAANTIVDVVRRATLDENTELHVSLAGGRKTMGYYLGFALSLYGRRHDRLSHVLVSQPFEFSRDFFYPSRETRIIQGRVDGNLVELDCHLAEVTLASIPYVRMRHLQREEILQRKMSYAEAVEVANAHIETPVLIIDLAGRRIKIAEKVISLRPSELAMLSVFAKRRQQGLDPTGAPTRVGEEEWAKWYLDEYKLIRLMRDPLANTEITEKALKRGMDYSFFSQKVSKINRIIKGELGTVLAAYYVIGGRGDYARVYGIPVSAENIHFRPISGIQGEN